MVNVLRFITVQYQWKRPTLVRSVAGYAADENTSGAEPHTKELAACLKYALLVWMSTRTQ